MMLAIGHELREIAERDQLGRAQSLPGLFLNCGDRVSQSVQSISRIDFLGKSL